MICFILYRKGKGLPEGVSVEGNRLIFTRPLNKTDEGVYECEARNSMGAVRAEFNVEIPGKWIRKLVLLFCLYYSAIFTPAKPEYTANQFFHNRN